MYKLPAEVEFRKRSIVKICAGYEKLGLTPVQPQLPELGKTRQHSAIIIKKVTK